MYRFLYLVESVVDNLVESSRFDDSLGFGHVLLGLIDLRLDHLFGFHLYHLGLFGGKGRRHGWF